MQKQEQSLHSFALVFTCIGTHVNAGLLTYLHVRTSIHKMLVLLQQLGGQALYKLSGIEDELDIVVYKLIYG